MYDPNKLKNKKIPEAGSKIKATISEIKSGKLGELLDNEVLKSWKNSSPEDDGIEIIATTEDGQERKRTFKLPVDNEVHPQSNLAKWKKITGKYPEKGQVIELIADENGFYQFPI